MMRGRQSVLSGVYRRKVCVRRITNPSVAIVGSGPGGFYVAKYLKKVRPEAKIDIIERWPVPYGLVRFGVAPDHPEVKSVINDFAAVAADENVRFIGNISVGTEHDISVETLRSEYNAVVLASGATGERRLNLPGEDLVGVLSARKFVGWYNGEPEVEEPPEIGENAVVIGHGNVALDCARILATPPQVLASTDINRSALNVLGKSSKVSIVGRRGPAQAAFTIKELRELTQIQAVHFSVSKEELRLADSEASKAEIKANRALQRKYKLIQDYAIQPAEASKQIELRFLLTPIAFEARDDDPTRLGAVVFERCTLLGEPGKQKAKSTGEIIKIPASIALTAVGYLTKPLHTSSPSFLSHLDHHHGKMNTPGLYCAGWCKRGPSGIIGTNITDARETVATMLQDLDALDTPKPGIASFPNSTSWTDWLTLDAHERSLGEALGAPRLKLTDVKTMLALIQQASRR